MPQTVVYVALSLDGFIAHKDGSVDWLPQPPEGDDFGWVEFIADIDAIVMGRTTFEQVLSFGVWPYEGTPLTVLSRTLTAVPEHLTDRAEVSSLAPRAVLEQLGARGCRRVYVDGGSVVQSFLREDRIDELNLTRVPVLLGEGIPLFGPLETTLEWDLVSSEELALGLTTCRYRRRR